MDESLEVKLEQLEELVKQLEILVCYFELFGKCLKGGVLGELVIKGGVNCSQFYLIDCFILDC